MNVGAFAVISQLSGYDESARSLEDFTGAASRRPLLAATLAFFLLSLIGIPFTGGFFGKFYVFSAAIHAGHVWLAVIGLLNSGVACFYYLRLLAALYAKPATERSHLQTRAVSVSAGAALTFAALATLLLGILPGRALSLAQRASESQNLMSSPNWCAENPTDCHVITSSDPKTP
jgi:NADH-quinone oxidoreductase subunit N